MDMRGSFIIVEGLGDENGESDKDYCIWTINRYFSLYDLSSSAASNAKVLRFTAGEVRLIILELVVFLHQKFYFIF